MGLSFHWWVGWSETTGRRDLSDADIDDRLAALQWALRRQAEPTATRIPGLDLWVAVIPRGIPPLAVFLRPRPGVATECELVWIEERLDSY